jgi:methylthioribose-1-phosphate isomerase
MDGMNGMKDAASALPPISKEVNKAKRAVVQELEAFLTEVESTRSTVTNIIESIDRMMGNSSQSQ